MNITVYTDEFCPRCKVLKSKMTTAGIEFTELPGGGCADLEQLGFEQLPVLKVDDNYLSYKEAIDYVNNFSA